MAFNPDSDRHSDQWWGHLFFALVLAGSAIAAYWYFTSLETTGGIGRVNWILALVYSIAGKWGAVLLLAIPAGLFFVSSGVKFVAWLREFRADGQ